MSTTQVLKPLIRPKRRAALGRIIDEEFQTGDLFELPSSLDGCPDEPPMVNSEPALFDGCCSTVSSSGCKSATVCCFDSDEEIWDQDIASKAYAVCQLSSAVITPLPDSLDECFIASCMPLPVDKPEECFEATCTPLPIDRPEECFLALGTALPFDRPEECFEATCLPLPADLPNDCFVASCIPFPDDLPSECFVASGVALPVDSPAECFSAAGTPLPADEQSECFEATCIPLPHDLPADCFIASCTLLPPDVRSECFMASGVPLPEECFMATGIPLPVDKKYECFEATCTPLPPDQPRECFDALCFPLPAEHSDEWLEAPCSSLPTYRPELCCSEPDAPSLGVLGLDGAELESLIPANDKSLETLLGSEPSELLSSALVSSCRQCGLLMSTEMGESLTITDKTISSVSLSLPKKRLFGISQRNRELIKFFLSLNLLLIGAYLALFMAVIILEGGVDLRVAMKLTAAIPANAFCLLWSELLRSSCYIRELIKCYIEPV